MQNGGYLNKLLRLKQSVFTSREIALVWREENPDLVKLRLNYYVRRGELIRLRRGLYATDKDYNRLEVATRIFTPAYVSFETVLAQAGLIFQRQTAITVASYLSRRVKVDNQTYVYHKLKESILTNPLGIKHLDNVPTATKERAVLDTFYIYANYYLDNLSQLDWALVFKLLPIYKNKSLTKRVNSLYQVIQEQDR